MWPLVAYVDFIDILCFCMGRGFLVVCVFSHFVAPVAIVRVLEPSYFAQVSMPVRGTLYILCAANRLYESTARKPWLTVYRAQQVITNQGQDDVDLGQNYLYILVGFLDIAPQPPIQIG